METRESMKRDDHDQHGAEVDRQAIAPSRPAALPITLPQVLMVALGLGVAAIFGQTLLHPYGLFDDDIYITQNPPVLAGLTWKGIAWAFTTGHAANWHPLTWLSLMLDVSLMGASPAVFHATNVLLHAANAALLFLCLRVLLRSVWRSRGLAPGDGGPCLSRPHGQTEGDGADGTRATPAFALLRRGTQGRPSTLRAPPWRAGLVPAAATDGTGRACSAVDAGRMPISLPLADWIAFAVAAFWAWHPLRVESVAWIAERKDVLAACFGLLSLYLCARQWPLGQPLPWTAWICFVLGCLAKPTLVMMPISLAALAWLLGVRPTRSVLGRLAAWCAVSLAMAWVTMAVQRAGGAMALMTQLAWPVRLANAVVSVTVYLRQTLWPSDLAVFYLYRQHQPLLRVGWGLVVLMGLCLACLPAVRRRWGHPGLAGCVQLAAAGVAWFLVNLVPVLGIVQVGSQAHADRYTYWPGLGLAMVVSAGLMAAVIRCRRHTESPPAASADDGGPGSSRPRRWLLVVATALGVVYAVQAFRQTALWRAPEVLVEHTIAVGGEVADARGNLGAIFAERGRFDEAVHQFELALRLHPSADNYANLANGLAALQRMAEARKAVAEAVRLKPEFAHGQALAGVLAARDGDWNEARARLDETRRLLTRQTPERSVLAMLAELEQRLARHAQQDMPDARDQ